MRTIAAFDKTMEAHILRARLQAEDIPAWVAHEYQIANQWTRSIGLLGVQIQVRDEDAAAAQAVVADGKAGAFRALLEEAFGDLDDRRCPKCGASDCWKRRPLLRGTLALLFGLSTATVPPLLVWLYFCNVCGTRLRSRYGLIGKAGANSKPSLVFAEAAPADLDAMMAVRESVAQNILRGSVEDERSAYEALLSSGGNAWTCKIGGFLRGFAIADAKTQRLRALFVDPSFARDGIGRGLHNAAVDWLLAQGAPALRLVTEPGTAAERFFRKAGWRLEDADDEGDHIFKLRPEAWARRRAKF
jgi:GNAT superfamily N-acetyltransferase